MANFISNLKLVIFESQGTLMTQVNDQITYQDIPQEHMSIILPLVQQLNPNVSRNVLKERLSKMLELDYHTIGAYLNEKLIGIASYWFGTRFWCGKYVDIDNVVINESFRRQGIAKKLIEQIENIAKENNCEIGVLDSYTSNHKSNRFYHKLNYHVEGFHFTKNLKG